MQFYPHRTVDEQAERLPEQLREAYKNSQIDRITIFDGTQELEITGYAEYSYLEEKSYKTQPVRTQDGVIQEIDEYATFLTPRLIIKYNMMGIDDYRSLMKMIKGKNGFIVKCYDVVEDKIVRNEMYVANPSMPIIYQQYLIALGIQEYAIEFIGTNSNYLDEDNAQKTWIMIGDDYYDAGVGFTWEDWIGSVYNTGYNYEVISIDGNKYVSFAGDLDNRVSLNGEPVKAEDYVFKYAHYDILYV